MPNKRIKSIFILIFLLQLVSCSKQSPPEVPADEAWKIRDQARLEACSKVNFTKDLLQHENSYFLFKCTGWDKQFPSLNRGIQNINPTSWNHFFKPIDDSFLNDKQRRDRIFDHIRRLDSKRGLDDLSRVITALNETNFYDGLRDMFVCAEDQNHPSRANRKDNPVSKKDIKNLIRLVELKPVAVKSLAVFINELMTSMGDDSESFREETKKFFYKDEFIDVRLNLVSSFAQKFSQGLTPLEREFFKKIPVTRWRDSEEPYIYKWIQKPTFTNALFRRLSNYAITENPGVLKDLKLLKRGYHYPAYCKPYSSNGKIDIDLKTHVNEFLTFVYENDYEPFHDYMIQSVASLQLAMTFCPKLRNYSGKIVYVEDGEIHRKTHSLDFVKLEKNLVDLTSEVPVFDISKFVTFLASRNLGNIPPNPGFLMDIATEEYVEWVVEMSRVVHSESDNYFDLIFKLLKNLKPEIFDSIGVLTNEFLLRENDNKIKALSKSWLFFNKEEKNFLFNFIDRHLQNETNFKLLFNFYATMLEEYAIVSPKFSSYWTESEESLEQSYRSLFDIVKNFSGENVLRDFDKFFSRDHIITIMKVIARGPELRRVALERLNYNIVTDYISNLPHPKYEISFSEGDSEYSRRAKICIDALTDDKTLYVLLNNFPKDCLFFEDKEITLKTFRWLSEIQDKYEDVFNVQNSGEPSLLDENGILSPATLNNSIALLRIVDEKLSFRIPESKVSGGLKYLMDLAQEQLYDITNVAGRAYVSDVVNIVKLAADYLD